MGTYNKSRLNIAATEGTWRLPSSPILDKYWKHMCILYVVVVAVVVVVVVAVDDDDVDDADDDDVVGDVDDVDDDVDTVDDDVHEALAYEKGGGL